jgi:REP element-mobilizing transposase RayT
MVTRSFLKAHAIAVETIREMLEDERDCPPELEGILRNCGEDEPHGEDPEPSNPNDDVESGDDVEGRRPNVQYFHVTNRIHLGRYLLEKDCVKTILAEECLHYARVCEIEIVHYCIMDNHFHLLVGVRSHSKPLSKMMGCIKQQFTNKFKTWFNGVYRKENRYRKKALTNGTLWQGRCKYERIEDDAQFGACSLYIENNRIVVRAKQDIGELQEAPKFQVERKYDHPDEVFERSPWETFIGPLQSCYETLLDQAKGFAFHSAPYYLGACEGSDTYLTSGKDAVWASDDEVREYFRVAASKLPEGWRKCWFKESPGIVKKPDDALRTFADNPFYARLGTTDAVRAAHYGRLLMGACYRKRASIAEIEDEECETDAGITF